MRPPQGSRVFGDYFAVHRVNAGDSIQAAIDDATPGDLILVGPGVYDELVVMWKPVKLQGWGAGAVTLNARQVPTEKINTWRTLVENLVNQGLITLLPGQELAPTGFPALGAPLFPTEEGAGIFVAGSDNFPDWFSGPMNQRARIDGFTIVGATQGGAIVVNGHANAMDIGNNRLSANAGFYGGGIRVGHPTLSHEDPDTGLLVYDDADNSGIRIHHNLIIQNGGINADGAGGGIALHTGADGYKVQKNWVCGNFSVGSGAGIGHLGFSDDGLIEDNTIIFNESFSQATAESGGGIYIGGQPGLQAIDGYLVSPGTGTRHHRCQPDPRQPGRGRRRWRYPHRERQRRGRRGEPSTTAAPGTWTCSCVQQHDHEQRRGPGGRRYLDGERPVGDHPPQHGRQQRLDGHHGPGCAPATRT